MPEQTGKSAERKVKDLEMVEVIFHSLVDQFHIVDTHRLGKLDLTQQTPRKLLVQLATKNQKEEILKNSKKLKNSEQWKSILIKARKKKEPQTQAVGEQESVQNDGEKTEEETGPLIPLNPFRNFDSKDPAASRKERNILVIGETGVGKSTWINGVGNYMKFDSYDEAFSGQQRPICVIPMEFDLWENLERINVSMRADTPHGERNEVTSTKGQSCTQQPKVYRFVTDSIVFNLIDTPGIGDTRGILYDIENMRMIMKNVAQWDKIHGICLLLKPNVARLLLSLRYCVDELLANLHRNSIPNIFVVFTNACATNYKPGDTKGILDRWFRDLNGKNQTELLLTDANTFYVDNEAVRMLYAHHNGVKFDKAVKESFAISWENTVGETYRLFDYVTDLDPHMANETKVSSIVREVSRELCSILADMDEQIKQEQKILDQQRMKHRILEGKLVEAKRLNVFNGEYLETIPITKPNMVCCGPDCTETLMDPTTNTLKMYHKKLCLEGCQLENVPPNQIGDSTLRACPIFDNDGICSACGCLWQTHMHILHLQIKKCGEIALKDEKIEEENERLERQIQAKSSLLAEIEQKVCTLKDNYAKVQQLAKPYVEFLKENSIIPLNESFAEYVRFSIEHLEKALKTGSDRFEIERLQKLLAIHQQQEMLASDVATSVHHREKITFANYSLRIQNLEKDSLVGVSLGNSETYKKLHETR